MFKRIRCHIHYWNKWRKKFPTAYSKWAKFLVLIGLSKPYTLRLLIFADRFNSAVVALNNLTEVFNQKSPEATENKEEQKEAYSDELSKM